MSDDWEGGSAKKEYIENWLLDPSFPQDSPCTDAQLPPIDSPRQKSKPRGKTSNIVKGDGK